MILFGPPCESNNFSMLHKSFACRMSLLLDACPCGMTSLCVAEPVSTSRLTWLPGSARGVLQSALTRLDVCLYDKTAAVSTINLLL